MEQLGFPRTVHRVLIVEIKGTDQHSLSKLAERGLPEQILQLAAQRLGVVVGATELAQIDQVIQPRVIEDLRALLDIQVSNLRQVEPRGDRKCEQAPGRSTADQIDRVEKVLQSRACDDPLQKMAVTRPRIPPPSMETTRYFAMTFLLHARGTHHRVE